MPDIRNALRAMTPWLALIIVVIALDQLTKAWVLESYSIIYDGRIEVAFFFDLVLAFNRGAAFSFLADRSGWQHWFFAVLALAVSAWLLALTWQHRYERLLPSAFALIIGGAIGNVIDRFNHGAVVDFLSFHAGPYYWPAFNLADSAIVLGVVLMLIGQFRAKKTTDTPPENPA
ncbi:MAG: signal peptidase II [Betaproteobacteria bacterium]|nr:signal peptidase II [Betaproteobacteria bacterium]